MKVGVYFSETKAKIGGGNTFKAELLASLMELAGESEHEFALISLRNKRDDDELPGNISWITLSRSFGAKLWSRVTRLAGATIKKLRKPSSEFRVEGWIEKHLVEHGVDVIFYLSPWDCITVELPYITIAWDLQHRIRPYFPEVSANGIWDKRERHYKRLFGRASVIITGEQTGKEEIERFYHVPSERIKTAPLPTPRFALEASNDEGIDIKGKYGLPEGYLFYPAQFWPHKNHVTLLRAVSVLRDKLGMEMPVVFSGSARGGNMPYIKKKAEEMGVSDMVHFVGFVPDEEMASFYRNAFALVFLSYFGPDNLPPLEAFAMGTPVVAADIPGAREQLGDAALLVEPGDADQVALAIEKLRDDSAARQLMIEKGKARSRQFTGRDYTRKVFAILDEFAAIRDCWQSAAHMK